MEMMTRRLLLLAAPLACLATAPVFAQSSAEGDDDDFEVTMMVLEEGDEPFEILELIELPDAASATAVERSAQGLDTANAAREGRREFGQSVAEEARQRAGEAGNAAEQARDNARDQFTNDVASSAIENLPSQARDNIPEEVRERIRESQRQRRGGG